MPSNTLPRSPFPRLFRQPPRLPLIIRELQPQPLLPHFPPACPCPLCSYHLYHRFTSSSHRLAHSFKPNRLQSNSRFLRRRLVSFHSDPPRSFSPHLPCRPTSFNPHYRLCLFPLWLQPRRQIPSRRLSPPASPLPNCNPCPQAAAAGSSSCSTRPPPTPQPTPLRPPTAARRNPPKSQSMAQASAWPSPALVSAPPTPRAQTSIPKAPRSNPRATHGPEGAALESAKPRSARSPPPPAMLKPKACAPPEDAPPFAPKAAAMLSTARASSSTDKTPGAPGIPSPNGSRTPAHSPRPAS